jgi:outer membrane protein OmpA-like peptidoglycan-associated protein
MAIDLNKSGEEKPKSRFDLSKSGDSSPSGGDLKSNVVPKKKFDLSKASTPAPVVDEKKEMDEPKKKFDLSKTAQPTAPASTNVAATPVSQPKKSKNSKTILFSILGIICLVAIVWFFMNKSKPSYQTNAGTELAASNDQTAPNENVSSNPEGATSPAANAIADSSQAAPASQTQPNASADNQTGQDQTVKAGNAQQVAPKPTQSANANMPYQKNESYPVYQFPFGDFNYSQANPELDKLTDVLRQNPGMKISISAYTDNTGDADFNMALSELRAKSIRDYLANKGIDAGRMKFRGKGISTKYATKAENRRAEFVLSE